MDGITVLPDSSPANSLIIERDSVFLVDNGMYIYMYVSSHATEDLLSHLFGVNQFEDIEPNSQLPEVESDFNARIHAIIERLRETKTHFTQSFKLVLEGQDHFEFFKCFVESN